MTIITMQAKYAVDAQPFVVCDAGETRFYLRGFLVEANPSGGIRIVATDGHALACFHDDLGTIAGGSAIIAVGKDILAAIKSAERGYKTLTPWLVIDTDHRTIQVCVCGAVGFGDHKVIATLQDNGFVIDGTFPDYRRVVPECTPGKKLDAAITFARDNLDRFGALLPKGSKSTSLQGITLYQSDDACAPFLVFAIGRTDFVGVIMPVRGLETDKCSLPEWYTAIEPAEAVAE